MPLQHDRGDAASIVHLGHLTPPPPQHAVASWGSGVFQSAKRPFTDVVEGRLTPSSALLMVTLAGGARRHEFATDDGLRFDGPDRPGSVSFLPAGCERRLRLQGVMWSWASISLGGKVGGRLTQQLKKLPAFCNAYDPVVAGVLGEMARVQEADGVLDPAYCETFAAMLTAHVVRKFGAAGHRPPPSPLRLTSHQLRRLDDYIHANLSEPIRVSSLARVLAISEGHLHRALKGSTGETPIGFINRRRVERAAESLRTSPNGIQEAALAVGFSSPSAFARVFRNIMGLSPAEYRRAAKE